MSTEELDRDGFTAAERAYFASGGKVTEGLISGSADEFDPAPEPTLAPQPEPAKAADTAPQPDLNADPFDDLEKVAKDNRNKTGKLIPEANFRAVSEKYKNTRSERDELRRQLEALEGNSKSWQDELAKEREMRARIDERLKLFNEVIAPAADPKPEAPKPPPNPEEDIFGYVKWLRDEHAREINDLRGQLGQTAEQLGQTTETIQSRDAETALRNTYQQDAVRFAQTEAPDFAQAYNHVNKIRDAMLESIGYSDPKQRAQIRMDEERSLVEQALKTGKSPASVMYGVAKSLGYVKAADPAPATQQAAQPQAQQPSVTAEIERLQKAQAASKSLSSGGGAAVGPMTVQQLADMTEAEFEAFARKNPAVVKQLMGG